MVFNESLSNLFGQSPIKPIEQHMSVAAEIARQLPVFFNAVIQQNWQNAKSIEQNINTLDSSANALQKKLRLHLPKNLFLPMPRSDLLELLYAQHKIANHVKEITCLALSRKMVIPTTLEKPIQTFIASSVATTEQALTAINELQALLASGFSGREIDIIESLIEELDTLEKQNDSVKGDTRQLLFTLEAKLYPIDAMFLYKLIDKIGDLADCAQQVGSRLQILLAR